MKYDFDRIRREVSVTSVVSRYVELKKNRACCPLHEGKNPTSFLVDDVKGWRCWDCGKAGGSLKFVQLMEGLSAVDAAKKLYEWYGLNGSEPKQVEEKTLEAVEGDNPPLKFSLKDVDSAHAYLHNRGFDEELCRRFGVGYYCSKQKTATFDNRIVFPLHNPGGELIGYVGRIVDDELISADVPRWKFPPKLVKNFLYNLHRVEGKFVVVCESPWGVLQLAKADIPAVAFLGKEATDAQVRCLERFEDVILLLDGGTQEAARRIVPRLMELPLKSLKVVHLPPGVQPDHLEPDELLALL